MQKFEHPSLDNFCKLNKNSQRWHFAWENLQEVFVMLVVVAFTFPGFFSMPPALHPGFSSLWRPPPALSSTLASFDCFTFPSLFYRKRYGFEWAFLTTGIFYLTLLPGICHNLLLSRLVWEPAVLPWKLQGLPLRFKTQTWPIYLFELHSVQQKVLTNE